MYTQEEIEYKINKNVPKHLIVSPFIYTGVEHTRVDVCCRLCGRKFNVYLWTLISDKESQRTGCGCEYKSKGEHKIRKHLQKLSIKFKQEKHFKECKYKNTLPFDFYIPSLDLCIEYNGKQHYKYIKLFHKTQEGFLERLERDKIKKEYAEKNHNFLCIPYWDFDNIENILEETINKLKNT